MKKHILSVLKIVGILAMIASLTACDVYTTGPVYGPYYCRYHRCGGPNWCRYHNCYGPGPYWRHDGGWRRWHRRYPGPYYG